MSDLTPEKATALRKPFPRESIGKLPKGGVMLDYVGHAAVTDRLLAVDPEWSWEPMALTPEGLPALDRNNNLWIRLTICGVTRIGVGDGKSAKECIGDAIRNAAMRFGVALDLWAKEDLVEFAQAAQSHRTPPPAAPQMAPSDYTPPADKPAAGEQDDKMTKRTQGQLFALFGQKGISEDQQLAGINYRVGGAYTSRADVTEADARTVIGYLKSLPDAETSDEASA